MVKLNKHYPLTCPHYSHIRDEMVTSIRQVTNLVLASDVLLLGTDEVSDEISESIFKTVQKLIKTSKTRLNISSSFHVDILQFRVCMIKRFVHP